MTIFLRRLISVIFAVVAIFVSVSVAYAQEHIVPATVTSASDVVRERSEILSIDAFEQEIVVRIARDDGAQDIATVTNDFTPLSAGDRVYLRVEKDGDQTHYRVYAVDRRNVLFFVGAIFAFIVVLFGGRSGVRSLIALVLSIGILLFVLMPVITAGYSPTVWGMGIAIALLALVMGVTHGLRPKTYIAFLGTSIAVVITGILAAIVTQWGMFSGIGTDEAFFLSVAGTSIDMTKLLLTGIVIGMLGVLDDVAITQVAVVLELKRAGVRGAHAIYARAMAVGRDHVGALINTLVLAYAGASLPLFLLLATYDEPIGALVSIEMVSVEIVRALIGSIGLILAVPITTFLATYFDVAQDDDGHTHGHIHNG